MYITFHGWEKIFSCASFFFGTWPRRYLFSRKKNNLENSRLVYSLTKAVEMIRNITYCILILVLLLIIREAHAQINPFLSAAAAKKQSNYKGLYMVSQSNADNPPCSNNKTSRGFLLAFPCDEGLVSTSTCNTKFLPAVKTVLAYLARDIYFAAPPTILVQFINMSSSTQPVQGAPGATVAGSLQVSSQLPLNQASITFRYPQALARQLSKQYSNATSDTNYDQYDILITIDSNAANSELLWFLGDPVPASKSSPQIDFRITFLAALFQGLGLVSAWHSYSYCFSSSGCSTSERFLLPGFAITLPSSVPDFSSGADLDAWIGNNMKISHWLPPLIYDSFVYLYGQQQPIALQQAALQITATGNNTFLSWPKWISLLQSSVSGSLSTRIQSLLDSGNLTANFWLQTSKLYRLTSASTLGTSNQQFSSLASSSNVLDSVYQLPGLANVTLFNNGNFITFEALQNANSSTKNGQALLGPVVSQMLQNMGYILQSSAGCFQQYGQFIGTPVIISPILWVEVKDSSQGIQVWAVVLIVIGALITFIVSLILFFRSRATSS